MAGGLAAWIGFTLPSAAALVAFALLTGPWTSRQAGWVHGLKVATVAVVAQAVFLMSRSLTPDWRRRSLAAIAAVVVLAWPTPLAQSAVILGGGIAGWFIVPRAASVVVGTAHRSPITRPAGIGFLVLFGGLLAGLALVRASGDDHARRVHRRVLPSGLARLRGRPCRPAAAPRERRGPGLGQRRPVPGRIWGSAGGAGATLHVRGLPRHGLAWGPRPGVPGAAIALVAIFLPSFLLVFGTLPFWDLLRRSEGTRRALAGANAAVVGLLLAALVTPVWTSAIAGPADVVLAAAALAALLSGRVPVVLVIAGAAAIGQVLAGI